MNNTIKDKEKLKQRHRQLKRILSESVPRLNSRSKRGLAKNRWRVKAMKRMLRLTKHV